MCHKRRFPYLGQKASRRYVLACTKHDTTFGEYEGIDFVICIDPRLNFQYEQGGTTAITVLLKDNKIYCVCT